MATQWAPILLTKPGATVVLELVKPRSQTKAIQFLRDHRDRLLNDHYKVMAISEYDGIKHTGKRLLVTFDENGDHHLEPDGPSALAELIKKKLRERAERTQQGK